jgi:hypothetical protein
LHYLNNKLRGNSKDVRLFPIHQHYPLIVGRSLTKLPMGNATFTTVTVTMKDWIGVDIQISYSHVTLSLLVRLESLLCGKSSVSQNCSWSAPWELHFRCRHDALQLLISFTLGLNHNPIDSYTNKKTPECLGWDMTRWHGRLLTIDSRKLF